MHVVPRVKSAEAPSAGSGSLKALQCRPQAALKRSQEDRRPGRHAVVDSAKMHRKQYAPAALACDTGLSCAVTCSGRKA